MRKKLYSVAVFFCVTAATILSIWLTAALGRLGMADEVKEPSPAEIAEGEALRDVRFDANVSSSLVVHRKVAPKGESPILAELVQEGKLPPLEERLPKEPVVLRGVDGIGNYGGTWLRLATGPSDISIVTYRLSGAFLFRWSPLGYPIEPHVAKGYTVSPDKRVWTIELREGMKWSDGHPFTADDVMYWWDCEVTNDFYASSPPSWVMIGGKVPAVRKLDDYRVEFIYPEPFPMFLEVFAQGIAPTTTPAHYLRQYHPDPAIGDQKKIRAAMADYKLPSPTAVYTFVKEFRNPEHPRLWPWVYRTYKSNPPQVFVRNPYYFVVDEAGNQLPYIDRMQFEVYEGRMLALTAANGGATMQDRHIRFADYTELMSRRAIAGTRVLHWYPATRSVYAINPNMNRRVDPDDPSTKWKAQYLADKRFRQALSLAIDRGEIIAAEYIGVGEPSQVAPGPESPFRHDKVANAFIEHDPARANALLDELGLTGRDAEGYRTFPDGTRMTLYLDLTAFTGVGPSQFIVDHWGEVGVRAIVRERTRPLFYTEKDAVDFDLNVWTSESDFLPMLHPRYWITFNNDSFYAVNWGRWYERGGFYGNPAAKGDPVPKDHPMYEGLASYEAALRAQTPQEQKGYIDRMLDIAAENTWTINISTPPPSAVVIDADLRNVPTNALVGNSYSTPSNAAIETYFFQNPHDSPGAIAETKRSLLEPTLRPRATDQPSGGAIGRIIRWLGYGIVIALTLLVALRHPFIGRRLVIMVPTLLVISVIVFTIIQLPPGDFLKTRMIMLAETGDSADLQRIEDLKTVFHSGDPGWRLYLRWMGFDWFLSFEGKDEGLLQGNLGRSMETLQPINEMVGDRLLLTVIISVGTILFTWATAIPIGIYSAVRQYSLGDYVLTLLGFVGMCVPAFLLALVLMAVSGVSGLFSPFYAAQPEWSWGKVVDLLKHVWIPILVLGVGGTAGMIRVMRANLLDELRKPYVITAMAKGVRPTKLLLKYPVRLALNPFISGIGALFPQVVSGGAIVSLVLALPTVGPLMLQALLTEDMYLAGSMLMILSMLGVFGTLVSDLLLLWLDPRIRYEGGTR